MTTLAALWAWLLAHPASVLFAWPLVTLVVNVLFGAAEKWAETHPRFALVLGVLEKTGLDARGLLGLLARRLRVSPAVDVAKLPKPPPLPTVFMVIVASMTVAWTLVIVSCTKQQVSAVTQTIQDVAKCVDEHQGEPPEQVAIACGLDATPDVVNVVSTLQRRKNPPICVTYTVDAGPSAGGPGK